jgi:hypothetical protein
MALSGPESPTLPEGRAWFRVTVRITNKPMIGFEKCALVILLRQMRLCCATAANMTNALRENLARHRPEVRPISSRLINDY